jgi:riboflavin biosynthesis pyrimidine reductase
VASVVCEGGSTTNAALFRDGVVDELYLSVAPMLAGGADPLALVAGEAGSPVSLDLRWMLEAEDTVFLRYGVIRSG